VSRRTSANDRVRRLLAIIPWIAERDGPAIAEVCARFGLTRAQLLADLEVVFLVGVHPFTPDELIDVVIEEERVWIQLMPGAFARPLRLTPEQSLALVAAGSSLLAAPGTDPGGPLARGLAKLARQLGIDEEDAVAIQLGTAQRETVDVLRQGMDERRAVRIAYYAFGRDEWTDRVVEPWRVFAEGGQWYVAAWCRRAEGERLFRVDRIRRLELLDEPFLQVVTPPGRGGDAPLYHPAETDPRVVLELAPEAAWVIEQYAHEEVETLAHGWTRVRLAVSASPWLERLLLRLGASARLVAADPPLSPDLGGIAAARVLARYQRSESAAGSVGN
jgi:proteasome accessory factor C